MKTLSQYAQEVLINKNSPQKLAELHIELATKFAFLSDIAKDLQIERAVFWQIKEAGDKPLSDTVVEARWRVTEGGKKEIRLKFEMKSIEKLCSAIKSSIVVNSIESRGSF